MDLSLLGVRSVNPGGGFRFCTACYNAVVRRPLEVIAIGCLIGIAPAHADNIDFHATANGSVATTDNANGTPTGQAGRDADVFSDVRPGFIVTYNAPRMIHELLSEVDFLYHLASSKPSVAGTATLTLPTGSSAARARYTTPSTSTSIRPSLSRAPTNRSAIADISAALTVLVYLAIDK